MRSLVFLLIFGNIVVFALSAGWIGGGNGDAGAVATASHQALSPDRIRIVSRGEPPPLVPQAKLCLEWHDLSGGQAAAIEKLAAAQKGLGLIREETRAALRGHWVFIPAPKGGKAASDKKAAELKALGVKDFRLVQEGGDDAWSIRLGAYDSEADAQAALARFKKSGVRSAQYGHPVETPAQFRIRVRGSADALAPMRKLAEPGAPVDCPAEAVAGARAPGNGAGGAAPAAAAH